MLRNDTMGPLPPPTGLRRRRMPRAPLPPGVPATAAALGLDPADVLLGEGPTARTAFAETAASVNSMALWRVSRLYCAISALFAVLAIVTAQTTAFGTSPQRASVFFDTSSSSVVSSSTAHAEQQQQRVETDAILESSNSGSSVENHHHNGAGGEASPIIKQHQQHEGALDWNWLKDTFLAIAFPEVEEAEEPLPVKHEEHHNKLPPWLRWLAPPPQQQEPKQPSTAKTVRSRRFQGVYSRVRRILQRALVLVQSLLDPALLHPTTATLTDLIDKVITSTPRLLAISNLLLSLTFLLHTAVADWFLGAGLRNSQEWAAAAGRERLGGFLVFKLLLISAVVAPDTLDLLILLSWYTLLSFLRSLSHLCAGTTQHTIQSGQPPRPGVLKLLLAVLCSDALAAAVCVALFHGAGWGMVLLLTCDCALLAVDVICHIMLHVGQVLEAQHAERVGAVEERQMAFHQQATAAAAAANLDASNHETTTEGNDLLLQARQLDRRLEVLEQQQVARMSILETTVFALQLFTHLLTVGHFVHIWSLHGVQFTLIDGVLALHLHSALSSASKKIAERRNMHRIARDMDGMFDDASELELRKAAAAGDVCCICLGTMTIGSVKKVGCGHLYHTSCLREVVERARSLEAARCPLCRASIMNGHRGSGHGRRRGRGRNPNNPANNGNNDGVQPNDNNNGAPNNNNRDPDGGLANGELALFRFSTEGIFPEWLPVPAFSFEVVRRPSAAATAALAQQQQQDRNGNNNRNNNNNNVEPRRSLMRRLLLLAGVVNMTPAEEAAALEQLVDMFPQYDRADLLRELRRRGSSEAVAESILVGVFAGMPRGGGMIAGGVADDPNNWRAVGEAAVR